MERRKQHRTLTRGHMHGRGERREGQKGMREERGERTAGKRREEVKTEKRPSLFPLLVRYPCFYPLFPRLGAFLPPPPSLHCVITPSLYAVESHGGHAEEGKKER